MLVVALQDDWTTYFTAIGTVGAAVAAVGIAWFGDKRAKMRLRQDREDALFAEACQVEVFVGSKDVPETGNPDPTYDEPTTTPFKALAAAITGGSFVITNIEVWFIVNGQLTPTRPHPLPNLLTFLPGGFGWHLPIDRTTGVTLTANAPYSMFETAPLEPDAISDATPVVRWTDRSGQRWQYAYRHPERIADNLPMPASDLPAAAVEGRLSEACSSDHNIVLIAGLGEQISR